MAKKIFTEPSDGSAFARCISLKQVTIIQCKEKRISYFEDKCIIYKSESGIENYDTLLWVKKKC